MYSKIIPHLVTNRFSQSSLNFKRAALFALLVASLHATGSANDCMVPSFTQSQSYNVGAIYVHRLVTGDFNKDGNLDLAASVEGNRTAAILWGNGAGGFPTRTVLGVGSFPISLVSGDFNNDSNLDLAVANHNSGNVYTFLGNGTGGFSNPIISGAGDHPFEIITADFNGDGNLDIVAKGDGLIRVLAGNGAGAFTEAYQFGFDGRVDGIKAGDFNGDNKLDIAASEPDRQSIGIVYGLGNGQFGAAQHIPVGGVMRESITVADFNGDGNLDISASTTAPTVLLGDGHGGFSVRTSVTQGGQINSSFPADVNGDGKKDIVRSEGDPSFGRVGIYLGDGQGKFQPPFSFPVKRNPIGILAADFNNDGMLDIASTDYFDAGVSILLNTGNTTAHDTTAPVITINDVTAYTNGSQDATVFFSPTVTDNVGGGTFNCSRESGSRFPLGTTTVTCTATDSCGNSSVRSFNVAVSCQPLDLSALDDLHPDATSLSGAVVVYPTINGVSSANFSVPSGSVFPVGTTTVNYVFTQPCGGSISGNFVVTVTDQPPILSLPNNIYVNTRSASGQVVSYSASASDTVSANVSVTCDHASGSTFPVGQTIVTCEAHDVAGNVASGSFMVYVFSCEGCNLPTFQQAPEILTEEDGPGGRVAIADFNNDGKRDIVLTKPDTGYLLIYLGDGIGNFAKVTVIPGNGSVPVATGDFNRDGKVDMVVAGGDGVLVYVGNGDGTFNDPVTSATSDSAFEIQVTDFNRDGKADLAMAGNSSVFTVLGDGAGHFVSPVRFEVPYGSNGVATPDLNGDGNPDLVGSNGVEDYTPVFLGDGTGNFGAPTVFHIGATTGFGVGDFNGDGKTDLAAANGGDNTFVVMLGNGSGGFSSLSSYPSGSNGNNGIRTTDFDGDGKLDLVTAATGDSLVSVALGDGNGLFSHPAFFAVGATPVGVALGDLNNDGRSDIVSANYGSGNFSLLLNTTNSQTTSTFVGTSVSVSTANSEITFSNVTLSGTTSVVPIADAATVGDVPGGFAVSGVAFEVSTTATFFGPVTTCFSVTTVNDLIEFNNLRVLHREGTNLIDRTSSHDFANRKICATTTSFSPFYLAKLGDNIKVMFDRTKAYRAGSTVPVKLQLLNPNGQNISSATQMLTARGVRRIGTNTATSVADAGNSNPDYNFRYDSNLQGYIYNLKTTGLVSGKYVLSLYAGVNRSFFYTVEFEIK